MISPSAEQIERLRKDRPSLMCDPECEGRCRVCPSDWADDVLTLLASLSQELERIRGENAKTATLALDNLRLQQSLETVKGEREQWRRRAEDAEGRIGDALA